jgi:C4-type Zn-finger protein
MSDLPPLPPRTRRIRRNTVINRNAVTSTSNILPLQYNPYLPSIDDIRCPVCNGEFQIYEYFTHLYTVHEEFLAVWSSVAFPLIDPEDTTSLTSFFRNLGINSDYNINYPEALPPPDEDVFDQLSYEQLTAICDEIGYHKVGVKDIESVAPAVVHLPKDNADTNASVTETNELDSRCPICLENMYQAVYMRTIKDCKHTFCGECIEEWLSKNKNCPICKAELEALETLDASETLPELVDP